MIDTAGNPVLTIVHCDCGLTGGCEKCQPQNFPCREEHYYYIFPETHEENFLSPDLEKFYQKKGYI